MLFVVMWHLCIPESWCSSFDYLRYPSGFMRTFSFLYCTVMYCTVLYCTDTLNRHGIAFWVVTSNLDACAKMFPMTKLWIWFLVSFLGLVNNRGAARVWWDRGSIDNTTSDYPVNAQGYITKWTEWMLKSILWFAIDSRRLRKFERIRMLTWVFSMMA